MMPFNNNIEHSHRKNTAHVMAKGCMAGLISSCPANCKLQTAASLKTAATPRKDKGAAKDY